jgi:hypothetical protein
MRGATEAFDDDEGVWEVAADKPQHLDVRGREIASGDV